MSKKKEIELNKCKKCSLKLDNKRVLKHYKEPEKEGISINMIKYRVLCSCGTEDFYYLKKEVKKTIKKEVKK